MKEAFNKINLLSFSLLYLLASCQDIGPGNYMLVDPSSIDPLSGVVEGTDSSGGRCRLTFETSARMGNVLGPQVGNTDVWTKPSTLNGNIGIVLTRFKDGKQAV